MDSTVSVCHPFYCSFACCLEVKYHVPSLRRQFQSILDHSDLWLILVGCVNSAWVKVQASGQSFWHFCCSGEGKH